MYRFISYSILLLFFVTIIVSVLGYCLPHDLSFYGINSEDILVSRFTVILGLFPISILFLHSLAIET